MRPRALPLALALALFGCEAPPSTLDIDGGIAEACLGEEPLEPALAELVERTREHLIAERVPGAAYAVVRDGLVETYAVGSRRPGECAPMNGDTRFFGLFGRHLAGVAVLAAAEAGEVSLDAPITDYLPTFRLEPPADASAITLRHLLTHTSGYSISHLNDCRDVDSLLAMYQEVPAWAPPGRVYLRLLFEYGLAGNALGDFRDAARRHVIEPFGLTGSFDRLDVLKGNIAIGSRRAGDELRAVPFSLVECPISTPYLGYFTSARDAGVFLRGLLERRGELLAGWTAAFYPPERATPTAFVRAPITGGGEWLEAAGRTRGYGYAVRLVPDLDFAVAVFLNAGHGDASLLAEDAVRLLTGRERALDATPPDTTQLAQLVGTYREGLGGAEIVIERVDGALTARVRGGEPLPMTAGTRFGGYVDDLFELELEGTVHQLRFWRDDDGVGSIISQDTFRDALGPPFFRVQ